MIDIFLSKIAWRWVFKAFTAGDSMAVQVDCNKDSLVDLEGPSTALSKWPVTLAYTDM